MRILLLLCLVACGFTDLDLDQDGVTVAEGDCDDLAVGVAPGAREVPYDGIDQDCNGTDLIDQDRDGYAAIAAGGDDCNDADPQARPGAWERFDDGEDQDCDGADATPAGPWSQISVGAGFACVLHAERNSVSCWGLRRSRSLASAPPATWTSVSAGGFHACATDIDGTTLCWGDLPANRTGLTRVTAGLGRTCGLDAKGDMVCWGAGFTELAGPFDDLALSDSFSGLALWTCATSSSGLECVDQRGADAAPLLWVEGSWSHVAVGGGFACALDSEQTVACWGIEVEPRTLTALAAGETFVCGLEPTGRAVCWGGLEAPAGEFDGISAGGGTACAWTRSGAVECWGEPLSDLE